MPRWSCGPYCRAQGPSVRSHSPWATPWPPPRPALFPDTRAPLHHSARGAWPWQPAKRLATQRRWGSRSLEQAPRRSVCASAKSPGPRPGRPRATAPPAASPRRRPAWRPTRHRRRAGRGRPASTLPSTTAKCKAVRPPGMSILRPPPINRARNSSVPSDGSARAPSSWQIVAFEPSMAAKCKGVCPSLSAAFAEAPFANNRHMQASAPHVAATWSGEPKATKADGCALARMSAISSGTSLAIAVSKSFTQSPPKSFASMPPTPPSDGE
mmetsp:Transcript_94059/g.302663  ORF Transcript_94059/g.302663 Transcript_94059/m.302663 type:complete len:269 (-) Transcript_94059:143-949(-)